MNPRRQFLAKVIEWARREPDLVGVMLVGSCARGEDRPDSDVDLVLITGDPARWLKSDERFQQFGDGVRTSLEDYGLVQSRRVFYDNGLEVEFGITSMDWLRTDPVDEGTRDVLARGYRILHDRDGILEAFVNVLRAGQANHW